MKGMSDLAVSTRDRRDSESNGAVMDTEEDFVCAFNGMRTELVSTLFFVLGNHDDAQDVAQEVFIKCWRTRAGLTDVKNLRAWIFRIGINAAKDLQRNAWRRRAKPFGDSPPPEVPGKAPTPSEVMENRETLDRLRKALHQLRPAEKEVFLLRQNGELTYEEIAAMRRTPVGTVKTQMRSALQKLRCVLRET
jgi:RNA polymerase sigma-70 factor, ECF subfamily